MSLFDSTNGIEDNEMATVRASTYSKAFGIVGALLTQEDTNCSVKLPDIDRTTAGVKLLEPVVCRPVRHTQPAVKRHQYTL